MAKNTVDPRLLELFAAARGYVVKRTTRGLVISRKPDMSRVKPSSAQKVQRNRMKAAAEHYRALMKDPVQAAKWRARAARENVPVSALVIGANLKNSTRR